MKAQELAQWVIDNRYPKSEKQKLSDSEMYHQIVEQIEKLEAEKKELLEFMKELKDRFEHYNDKVSMAQIESLIQKIE